MKFTIPQDKLFTNVQALIGVVPTKSTFPVLANILLEAHGDKLRMSATDLEVAAVTQVDAAVSAQGAITVPARQFFEIVKQLPPTAVELETAENKVTIRCDRSRFNIVGLPKDDFPKMPEVKRDTVIKLPSGLVPLLIKRVLFAVNTDASRPAQCGVFIQMGGDKLKAVTTDGRRLAMFEMLITPLSQKSELLLSPKGLNMVNRMMGGQEGEVSLQFDESYAKFAFGGTQVFARHIEGTFPEYEKVIPPNNQKVLRVNLELFSAAVRRVSILSDTFTYQIRMSLKPESVDLSSQTVDIGEAKESLAASYNGDEMEVGYNASYLLDILRNLESEEVDLYLNTPLSASLIMPDKDPADYKITYLLMPLRLPE